MQSSLHPGVDGDEVSFVPTSWSEEHSSATTWEGPKRFLSKILLAAAMPTDDTLILSQITQIPGITRGPTTHGQYFYQRDNGSVVKFVPKSESATSPHFGTLADPDNEVHMRRLSEAIAEIPSWALRVEGSAIALQKLQTGLQALKANFKPCPRPPPPPKTPASSSSKSRLPPDMQRSKKRAMLALNDENDVGAPQQTSAAKVVTSSAAALQQNPALAEMFIGAGNFIARTPMGNSLIAKDPASLSPDSKAARTVLMGGQVLAAMKAATAAATTNGGQAGD